jgi:hypothetical protein
MPDDADRWRRLESVVHAALVRPAENSPQYDVSPDGDSS